MKRLSLLICLVITAQAIRSEDQKQQDRSAFEKLEKLISNLENAQSRETIQLFHNACIAKKFTKETPLGVMILNQARTHQQLRSLKLIDDYGNLDEKACELVIEMQEQMRQLPKY